MDGRLMRRPRRPFLVERRPIARKPRRGGKPGVSRYPGVVEPQAARPAASASIAADVARLLAGRTNFPRELWSEAR